MISVKANWVRRVILVGLLSTLTGCAQHTQVQTQARPRQGGEAKPSSTTNGAGATQELVPLSAPAAPEPTEPAPPPQIPAGTARPSNDGDDPRAVIEWLLDRSSRGR